MDAKKCDRCGKYYEHYGDDVVTMRRTSFKSVFGRKDYDLCFECMKELQKWLQKGAKTNG